MHRDDKQVIVAIRWLAVVSLFLFLAQLAIALLTKDYSRALFISLGIIPILVALLTIRGDRVSLPAAILGVDLVLLVTYLASVGNGIYDIAVTAHDRKKGYIKLMTDSKGKYTDGSKIWIFGAEGYK